MQDKFLNFEKQIEDEGRLKRAAEDAKLTGAKYVVFKCLCVPNLGKRCRNWRKH